MTWNTIDNITLVGNETDLVSILRFPSLEFSLFWPLIMLSLFLFISFRTFLFEKEKVGKGNLFSSLAISSFATALTSLLLNIVGVIDRIVLAIIFGFTIVFITIYMLTKNK